MTVGNTQPSSHTAAQQNAQAGRQGATDGGVSRSIRGVFYRYDPVDGTKAKLGRCSVAVIASAGMGAVALDHTVRMLPSSIETGASILSRSAQSMAALIQRRPLLCGIAVGSSASILGLRMLGSSLKPLTEKSIQSVKDSVVHKFRQNCQQILENKKINQRMESLGYFSRPRVDISPDLFPHTRDSIDQDKAFDKKDASESFKQTFHKECWSIFSNNSLPNFFPHTMLEGETLTILLKYPILLPDENGKINSPSNSEFQRFMPE